MSGEAGVDGADQRTAAVVLVEGPDHCAPELVLLDVLHLLVDLDRVVDRPPVLAAGVVGGAPATGRVPVGGVAERGHRLPGARGRWPVGDGTRRRLIETVAAAGRHARP